MLFYNNSLIILLLLLEKEIFFDRLQICTITILIYLLFFKYSLRFFELLLIIYNYHRILFKFIKNFFKQIFKCYQNYYYYFSYHIIILHTLFFLTCVTMRLFIKYYLLISFITNNPSKRNIIKKIMFILRLYFF